MSEANDNYCREKALKSHARTLIKYARRNADRAVQRKKQIERLKAKIINIRNWVKMIKKKLHKYELVAFDDIIKGRK